MRDCGRQGVQGIALLPSLPRPALSCRVRPSRAHRQPQLRLFSNRLSDRTLAAATAGSALERGFRTRGVEGAFSEAEVEQRSSGKVLVAGAGITGLVAALGLLKQGFDVEIFERDLTAIRGEGKYRGPIQIQSNALAALEAIDAEMAEEVFDQGVVTGDRINGLCDGLTGEWYVKFDTFSPAAQNGLPVTRVINRVTLQEILTRHVEKWSSRGENVIRKNCTVVGYKEDELSKRVEVILENGERYSGDLLIGADGIWSRVRSQLFGPAAPTYSEYTCYTGIADFVPPDIDTVGYRVFLGNGKYFVSSDVGNGKMQWYGFHKEPEGGTDPEGGRKSRLLEIFGSWCDAVVDLLVSTPEEDILRRDIYDKPPIFQWSKGRVVIMGDAAHAMQPNLGQGGCMAIEDAFQLCIEFNEASLESPEQIFDYSKIIETVVERRALRAAVIHWLAAMAAISATTYKTYMGEGLGPLSFITRYKVPHFGRVVGQIILKIFMPFVLGWVLGGNARSLERGSYVPQCRLGDRPQAYDLSLFRRFVSDDRVLEQAALADWMLLPHPPSLEDEGVMIDVGGVVVGSSSKADVQLSEAEVAPRHAKLFKVPSASAASQGSYQISSLTSGDTSVNGRPLTEGQTLELSAGDILHFGRNDTKSVSAFKIKLRHISSRNEKTEPALEENLVRS